MIFLGIAIVVLIEFIIILICRFKETLNDLKDAEEIIKDTEYKIELLRERKSLLELGFDPLECMESHFPGDCPLCGAD